MKRLFRRLHHRWQHQSLRAQLDARWSYTKLCIKSLFYNHHLSQSYISDILLEPIFYIADNFSTILGPFFVVAVFALTSAVVFVCYYIGLPFWWAKSPPFTVVLLIVGNLLLLNVAFNYYMAVVTRPGYPPEGRLIAEAVTICKKCIRPKPPRTHHCSVCNRCILKYDHHCPWLNNCVGHFNHRYFFLYMAYTSIGVIFIIVFGLEIGYNILWLGEESDWEETERLVGNPVRFNLTGHVVPFTEMNDYELDGVRPVHHVLPVPEPKDNSTRYRLLVFIAIVCVATLIALGTLTVMHAKQITRGETSVEAYINRAETERLARLDKRYTNAYDFGARKNWRLFLGLVRGRTFLGHVLLPSAHRPEGNGISWHTIHEFNRGRNDFP